MPPSGLGHEGAPAPIEPVGESFPFGQSAGIGDNPLDLGQPHLVEQASREAASLGRQANLGHAGALGGLFHGLGHPGRIAAQ